MEVSCLSSETKHTLETVRVLHETVLALRGALEGSRKELSELRSRFQTQSSTDVSDNKLNEAVQQRLILENDSTSLADIKMDSKPEDGEEDDVFEAVQNDAKPDSGAESDDIDDIELVFTTGETDPGAIHEDMVPILEEGTNHDQIRNHRSHSNTRGHHRKTLMHTVIVETDISKCGVSDETEALLSSRRNTLPDPLPYRPIVHREILAAARVSPCKAAPLRPVLGDRSTARQETGAQTDITALPAQWKSETYLAHKISYNLTTLPSKFTLPVPRVCHAPFSDKSREARRVMLSDINFTSMVPELSRSADHLHQDDDVVQGLCKNYPGAFDYMKSFDVGRDGRSPRAERHGSRSSWGSYYSSRCQASSTSIAPLCEEPRRRHSWRAPSTVCCHARHVWSSVPSSPTRCLLAHHGHHKKKNKVTFHHCNTSIHPGQSLPDLRIDDSGESTDSLVDEAEEFLRHSIDSIIIGKGTRRRGRRHSDPDPVCGEQHLILVIKKGFK